MNFEFTTAGRICFGPGCVAEIPALAAACGTRALLVRGLSRRVADWLVPMLEETGVAVAEFAVEGEPVTATIDAGLELLRRFRADMVIGIGGGSVVDTAKALATLTTQPAGPWIEHLEVVGSGRPLQLPPLPSIAVPTTAGTGSEVTRNAVIGVPEKRVKVSLRHAFLLPRYAVVDPELTHGLPPDVTAYTGLDAMIQCMEVLTSPFGNPLTDALCREGLQRARSLERAWRDDEPAARADMALAALCGGLGLANGKLGAVHGLTGPLGGMANAPHGALCAALWPAVWRANIAALDRAEQPAASRSRFDEAARLVTGDPAATAEDGAHWVATCCATLQVPPLAHWGITAGDKAEIVAKAQNASSMKGNPVKLTDNELNTILEEAGL